MFAVATRPAIINEYTQASWVSLFVRGTLIALLITALPFAAAVGFVQMFHLLPTVASFLSESQLSILGVFVSMAAACGVFKHRNDLRAVVIIASVSFLTLGFLVAVTA